MTIPSIFPQNPRPHNNLFSLSIQRKRSDPLSDRIKKEEKERQRLDGGLVRKGVEGLGSVVGDRDGSGLTGLSRETLELDVLCNSKNEPTFISGTSFSFTPHLPQSSQLTSLLLGLPLLGSVANNSVQELLPALGVLDVLYPQVDTLLHVSTVDDLVADDTDSSGGDVVDDTGLSVVELVGLLETHTQTVAGLARLAKGGFVMFNHAVTYHTLLLSGVGLDVNDITDSVSGQVSGHLGGTMF